MTQFKVFFCNKWMWSLCGASVRESSRIFSIARETDSGRIAFQETVILWKRSHTQSFKYALVTTSIKGWFLWCERLVWSFLSLSNFPSYHAELMHIHVILLIHSLGLDTYRYIAHLLRKRNLRSPRRRWSPFPQSVNRDWTRFFGTPAPMLVQRRHIVKIRKLERTMEDLRV